MRIPYQFPVVYLDEDDYEDTVVTQENGHIYPIHLDKEPYEATVEAHGYSFHVIFGTQAYGNFLCIPNWNLGCELASLDNKDWNLDSLLNTDALDYESCTAIIWALCVMNDVINAELQD